MHFPLTFSAASFLTCCFFLMPRYSFTVIPALCKHASVLQKGQVSTIKAIWLHTTCWILPQDNLEAKVLLKELSAVFLGTLSYPMIQAWKIRKKLVFYPEMMKLQDVQSNLFCTRKRFKTQHSSFDELQSTWNPVSSVAVATRSHPPSINQQLSAKDHRWEGLDFVSPPAH